MATAAQKTGTYIKNVYDKITDAITERMPKFPEKDPNEVVIPGKPGGEADGYRIYRKECEINGETPLTPEQWAKANK